MDKDTRSTYSRADVIGGGLNMSKRSHNFKEASKAHQRMMEKIEREESRKQQIEEAQWEAEEQKKYAPTDKKELKKLKRDQAREQKLREKELKKQKKRGDYIEDVIETEEETQPKPSKGRRNERRMMVKR